MSNSALQVSEWYKEAARPLMEELEPKRVAEFDRQCAKLNELATSPEPEFSACFLGKCAVGKSTLINALVAENAIVLPTGGIGPLTALAIEVRYSETPYFRVRYHARQQLQQVILPLEQLLERRRKAAAAAAGGDAVSAASLPEETDSIDDPGEASHRERQAGLLVKGDQFRPASLEYLVECLKAARSGDAALLENVDPEDRVRLQRIHEAVNLGSSGEAKEFRRDADPRAFHAALREHAAGFLSPLIKEGELGWPSDLLKSGMVLVDLPGVGIANDAYRTVTASWVRDRAQTICLVVDKAGVDADSARMLSDANFLNRLIHRGADREIDPVQIMVGVVKMDQNVQDKFSEAEQADPDGEYTPNQFVPELFREIPGKIKGQLRGELQEEFRQEGVAGEAQREAIEAVLSEVEVHPLTAVEYKNLKAGRMTWVKAPEETGIPQLRESLMRQFAEFRQLPAVRKQKAAAQYAGQLTAILRAHEQEIENAEVDTDDAERLRTALGEQERVWARKLDKHDLAFREFLQSAIPAKIGELIASAALAAERDMHRYINGLDKSAHWRTLQAAVRRGNAVFSGATEIDLPSKFAEFLDNQVAPRWRSEVLKPLRERAAALGGEYVRLVEEVIEWAEAQEARSQARSVAALRDQIRTDADGFAIAAKESAQTLQLEVKKHLMNEIEKPIRRRCQTFLDNGENHGRYVKDRIIALFHELVSKVIDSAGGPVRKFLNEAYNAASQEMMESFQEYPDPVHIATERILAVHIDSERRALIQQRARELRKIRAALESAPAVEVRQ